MHLSGDHRLHSLAAQTEKLIIPCPKHFNGAPLRAQITLALDLPLAELRLSQLAQWLLFFFVKNQSPALL